MIQVCNIGITALGLSSYVDNLGSHMKFVSAPDITELMQKLWAMGLLLVFSISFSKISVLIYYGRVFRVKAHPSKIWRWAFYSIFVTTNVSLVAFTLVSLFQCQPVQKFWTLELSGSCYSYYSIQASNAIWSAVMDVLILLLPLPPIWKLKLKIRRKLALAGMFVLGYS